MKKFLLAAILLACSTIYAEKIHFFGGGDFNTDNVYGQGVRAIPMDSKVWRGVSYSGGIMFEWKKDEGFVNFKLFGQKRTQGFYEFKPYFSDRVAAGLTFKVNAKMKGKGFVRFQMVGDPGVSEWVKLSDKWQNYTMTLDNSKGINPLFKFAVGLKEKGSFVDIDDLTITAVTNHSVIVPPTGALIVPVGSEVPPQKFQTFPRDLKGHFIFSKPEDSKTVITPATALNREVMSPGFTADKAGIYHQIFTTTGVSALQNIIAVPQEEAEKFDAAAGKIDLRGKPMRMLFLADSLTDFSRDYNYAAITAGMIEKFNPGQVTFRNSGIGGDLSKYIYLRMLPDSTTLRAYMYDGLWHENYDIIFIFVGQNDTVSFPSNNYKHPQLPISQVNSYLRQAIAEIRTHSRARIVIFSGVSTPVNNSKGFRFGIPKHVEAYNACARKVAADNGCDFFDIYSILKELSNDEKLKLFNSDLVHLAPAGHRFVALKLLEFLGK